MGEKIMRPKSACFTCFRATVALTLLLASGNAMAYLDPSTGSMVISALVGILASAALAVKTFWYRIKRRIGRAGKPTSPGGQSAPGKD